MLPIIGSFGFFGDHDDDDDEVMRSGSFHCYRDVKKVVYDVAHDCRASVRFLNSHL